MERRPRRVAPSAHVARVILGALRALPGGARAQNAELYVPNETDPTNPFCPGPPPPGATGWPNMFHGCGYGNAVHWLTDGSTFFQQPQDSRVYPTIATWVR